MDIDTDKIDKAVLAVLYLTLHDGVWQPLFSEGTHWMWDDGGALIEIKAADERLFSHGCRLQYQLAEREDKPCGQIFFAS